MGMDVGKGRRVHEHDGNGAFRRGENLETGKSCGGREGAWKQHLIPRKGLGVGMLDPLQGRGMENEWAKWVPGGMERGGDIGM